MQSNAHYLTQDRGPRMGRVNLSEGRPILGDGSPVCPPGFHTLQLAPRQAGDIYAELRGGGAGREAFAVAGTGRDSLSALACALAKVRSDD